MNLLNMLVQINKSFIDFIGYTRNELLNMRYMDFTHPDDHEIKDEEERGQILADMALLL